MKGVDRVLRGFRVATMASADDLRRSELEPRAGMEGLGIVDSIDIALAGRKIVWMGATSRAPVWSSEVELVLGEQRWLTPGLIDCHTHLVYGGHRAEEWERRLAGATYTEIAQAGGGILSTVRATRAASQATLYESAAMRLQHWLRNGVTTIEIKSGYGLDLETERKMLQVAQELGRGHSIDVVPTLLAAHAIPEEYRGRPDAYVDWICREMIPASVGLCTSVDAFCETIAFDWPQTERVLRAAREHGLAIRLHAEQLSSLHSAARAAELGALSVDHLEYLQEDECSVLAKYGTVAVMLPGAFYTLRETQLPPVEGLRAAGVPMAVATDANPGSSPIHSLLIAANMACNLFRLTVEEAWLGMTRHAARALGLQGQVGVILPGHQANLAIWEGDCLAEVLFSLGHQPCVGVYYRGQRRLM